MILRAPGTNCDLETAFAFERAGAVAERAHINQLLSKPQILNDYQILCIPGGFSYGDDIAAGRILGNQLRHHLGDPLQTFKSQGKLILGICNGFQVLMRSGLFSRGDSAATLTLNDSGRFEARWVNLRIPPNRSIFFRGIQAMYLPVAHAEGKFVTPPDAAVLLRENGQVVAEYSSGSGEATTTVAYPDNPNGSVAAIAGICDPTGRICGLMPHPERFIDPLQHPRWSRGEVREPGDGLRVFQNAVTYFD